jgi:hypothetical protein
MDALRIVWNRAELDEAIAALEASSAAHGRKKAVDALARARRRVETKPDPDARVMVLLAEKASEVLADELRARDTDVAKQALERLEVAALEASRRPGRQAANIPGVKTPNVSTRDQRVHNPGGGHRAR